MNIGVLGTGVVARTLGQRLTELGHSVALGSRDPSHPAAAEWLSTVGSGRGARIGTFADAAGHGALLINATSGAGSIAALRAAGDRNLHGKVLVDVSNPLDFSSGELVLPVGRQAHFTMEAVDVIHSFWVPNLGQKMDAVPGIETTINVTPNRTGEFAVVCTELCGLGHATMRANARVVTQAEFDEWIEEQRT